MMAFVPSILITALHWLVLLFVPFLPCQGTDIACCPSNLTTVSVGSTLPPDGASAVDERAILLMSYNGTYVLELRSWKESNALTFCMAAVRNTKISPGSQIWAANNAIPVEAANGCSMKLSEDGDFSLQFNGNNQAWHTNTGRMGVQNLSLEDTGNLVLLNTSGHVVWQSFDQSPVFFLATGMRFTKSTVLLSSAPVGPADSDFSTAGKYAMKMNTQGRLVMYLNVNGSSFVYWNSSIVSDSNETVAYAAVEDGITFYDNQNNVVGKINPTINQSIPQGTYRTALVDEQSGNLRAFYRAAAGNWKQYFNSSITDCENPTYCGEFNLCDPATGQCTCPPSFRRNGSQPGADCEPSSQADSTDEETDDCSKKDYDFVEVNVSFPSQLSAFSVRSPDECRKSCAGNCATCNAALYNSATGSCSLFLNLQTLPRGENSGQVLFLKILAKNSKKRTMIGVLTGVLAALGLSFILGTFVYRRRLSRQRKFATDELFLSALPRLPPRFTLRDLRSATQDFSTKIGAGGFGSVYEGVLSSGARVAVKKLEGCAGQSSDQFRAEVATIGSVSHTNLVRLKGFCMEGEARLLVYERIANGSLDKWLFRPLSASDDATKVLEWGTRCRIASDAARGLAYLHHECGERIVHCDVKPENILLDEEWNAKVADFGLAKLMGGSDQSFVMTTMKGTRGYLAPEWLREATITAKSDVYSYGVVLLELVTGRRCIDGKGLYLPTWVKHELLTASQADGHTNQQLLVDSRLGANGITNLLDERLHGTVPLDSLQRLVFIALSCLQPEPIARPSMASVVQMLDGLLPIPSTILRTSSIQLDLDSPPRAHLGSVAPKTTSSSSSQVLVPSVTTSNADSLPNAPSSWLLAPSHAR